MFGYTRNLAKKLDNVEEWNMPENEKKGHVQFFLFKLR